MRCSRLAMLLFFFEAGGGSMFEMVCLVQFSL
jgi:hypothetical protein